MKKDTNTGTNNDTNTDKNTDTRQIQIMEQVHLQIQTPTGGLTG